MNILGLESSCDETAAAVVRDGRHVLSSSVASQILVHQKYGGVVPELASREHLRAIVPVVEEALSLSGLSLANLSAIAVTQGPGLVGSLLVGITFAKSLAFAHGLPLIPVHHLDGHIHAVLLEHPEAALPALALVVSGGHTHLFLCRADRTYSLIAKTRDDAAGEAFDKVAKLLGFGYPGGPIIDRLAPHGNPHAIRFTKANMKGNALDFSFSGLKTAVLRHTEAHPAPEELAARRALLKQNPKPSPAEWLAVTSPATLDLLASFQHAVVSELLSRIKTLATHPDSPIASEAIQSVIITGGVACNAELRAAAARLSLGLPVFFPTPKLSTDNAAMIAAAAFPLLAAGRHAGLDLKARANFLLQG